MMDGETNTELLERRWFAAYKAASAARSRCEELLDAMERIEQAWNEARAQLSDLERLRDTLGETLAAYEVRGDLGALENSLRTNGCKVMSAA